MNRPKHDTLITYRRLVLEVVQESPAFLTGQQIAQITGLTYRQTIDALNALNNSEKIARTGRKFTARWGRIPQHVPPSESAIEALEHAFKGFFK